jgi:hypothetical protein|eukprot:606459-Prymnesium_polylepis.2
MDRREAVVGEAELLRAENFHLKRRVRSLEAEVEQLRQVAVAVLGKRQKRTEAIEQRSEAERDTSELHSQLRAFFCDGGVRDGQAGGEGDGEGSDRGSGGEGGDEGG